MVLEAASSYRRLGGSAFAELGQVRFALAENGISSPRLAVEGEPTKTFNVCGSSHVRIMIIPI